MNSWLRKPSLPSQTIENQGSDQPTQVGFAHLGVVLTATILIPNSGFLIGNFVAGEHEQQSQTLLAFFELGKRLTEEMGEVERSQFCGVYPACRKLQNTNTAI